MGDVVPLSGSATATRRVAPAVRCVEEDSQVGSPNAEVAQCEGAQGHGHPAVMFGVDGHLKLLLQ